MIEAIVTGIVGALLLLAFAWLHGDIARLATRLDRHEDRLNTIADTTARTEAKLDTHLAEHQRK